MQRITTDTRTSIGRRNIHPLRKSPYQGDTGRTAFRIHPRTGAVQRMQLYQRTGNYLYEPNASLLKAGAFRSIASAFPVKKLHPNSHLYTSDVLVESFPGRAFHIISQCSLNKKELKESLGDLKKQISQYVTFRLRLPNSVNESNCRKVETLICLPAP